MTRGLLAGCLIAASCAGGPVKPHAIALGQDPCAHCRMVVVSMDTAAQIVAAGDEPQFFDEIGCLRDYLRAHTPLPDAIVYVADHRTHEWVDARVAVFTRTAVSTPMASGLLAHANTASRDADPAAHKGSAVARGAILGPMAGSANP
jgi:copper chaperone NosL